MSMLNNVDNALEQLRTARTHLEAMRRQIQNAPAAGSSTSQTSTQGSIVLTNEQARRIKEAFSCTICVDYFDSPYTLQCGHTFCKDCITTWFGRQKSCPGCRRDIIQRPVPAFTVETQVKTIRALIPSLGPIVSQTNQEEEQTVRQFERLLDDLFPARANTSFIRDEEDGVDRCPTCAWELDDDGRCLNCNLHFRQAARPHDTSDSSESSEEEDEEDSDLNSFITSDDHVSVIQSDSSDQDPYGSDTSDVAMSHRVYNIDTSDSSDDSDSDSSDSSSSSSSDDAPIHIIPSSVSGNSSSSDDSSSSEDDSSSDDNSMEAELVIPQSVSDTSEESSGDSSTSSDDDSDASNSNSDGDQVPIHGKSDGSTDSDKASDNDPNSDSDQESDKASNKNESSESSSSSCSSSSSSDNGDTEDKANDTAAEANTQEEPTGDEDDDGELRLMTRKRRKLLNSDKNNNSEDETPVQANKRSRRRSTRRR